MSPPATHAELTPGRIVRRLLGFSWKYRWGCLRLILLQGFTLALAIAVLKGVGFGIDLIRFHAGDIDAPPAWLGSWKLPAQWSAAKQIGAAAIATAVIEAVRAALNSYYIRTAGYMVHAKIVVDLRAAVYEKMQRLSFRFFDANATGSVINRVTGDVQSVRAFIDGVLIQLVILVISLVCYLGYMLSIHVGLTLACLASTPLLWVLTAWFSRLVRPQYDLTRELSDEVVLRLSENIQGAQVIKGFGREREEIAKFSSRNAAVRDQQQGIFQLVSFFTPLIGFFTQLNLVVLLAYGGTLTANGELPLGSGLVVFAGLLQQFSSQVANMTNLTNSIQQSLSGAKRVFEILDAVPETDDPPHPIACERVRGEFAAENVSFAYRGETAALQNVSFTAEPGTCTAIVGPTGSGKSTLLALLCRFYDPTSGRITLDGRDLREYRLADLRRNIGIVFQETFLFSSTVAANIAFGHPEASRERIEAAAKAAAAHEFIVNLPHGYDTVLGEAGLDLSGGQRQRLAIARALLLDPAILLLDDPVASVDPQTEEEILSAVASAARGRTTFLVAHRLSALLRADRVLVWDRGAIVQHGTPRELLERDGWFREAAAAQWQSARLVQGEESP